MRFLYRGVLIIGFVLLGWSIGAQTLTDSLAHHLRTPPSFMMKFDTRHSFITAQHAKIFGMKFGLDHGNRVQYGGGINWLVSQPRFDQELEVNDPLAGDTMVQASLHFGFFSPYFEYTFYHSPHWEVSIPVQIGIGGSNLQYTTSDGKRHKLREGMVFTYEPAMTVQYKFWRYFGIGGGVGYRLMLIDNSKVKENFTSPIYILRFKVFFSKIYRDIFPKKEGQ